MVDGKYKNLFMIGLMLLGSACSSGRSYTRIGMQETLEVQILPNSSKMFVYRLKMPDEQIPSHIHISRNGRESTPQAGVDLGSHSYRSLLTNVSYVIKKSGYCREGFFEIDKSLSRYHLWMKGECKEGASVEDRQKFGVERTLTADVWK